MNTDIFRDKLLAVSRYEQQSESIDLTFPPTIEIAIPYFLDVISSVVRSTKNGVPVEVVYEYAKILQNELKSHEFNGFKGSYIAVMGAKVESYPMMEEIDCIDLDSCQLWLSKIKDRIYICVGRIR